MKNTNLIIGKANTGKTKEVLFNEVNKMIDGSNNILMVDSREEYYSTFGEKLKNNGYNVIVLNFNDTTKSNGYNPLLLPYKLFKDNKKDQTIDMLKDLNYNIYEEIGSDPFWTNMASDYTTGLLLAMFKLADESQINLGSLSMMISQADEKYKESSYIKEYLNGLDLLDSVYISASGTVFSPPETRASIVATVRQKLNMIVMKENLLKMLSANDFDLSNISDKTAIFVIGKSPIVNTFINQLYYIIKEKKMTFNIIIDNIEDYKITTGLKEMIKNANYNNLSIYISVKDIDAFSDGRNYIENVIETPCGGIAYDFGDYDEYPTLKDTKLDYFNFKDYIENKNKTAL